MIGNWFFEVKGCFATFSRFGFEAGNWSWKDEVFG
jgi:hypothetical protein